MSREHVLHEVIDASTGQVISGVYGRLKSIAKHKILGAGLKGDLCKIRVDGS